MFRKSRSVELISMKKLQTERDLKDTVACATEFLEPAFKSFKLPETIENHVNEESNNESITDSKEIVLDIEKTPNGCCGFHLTRTQWDPYPWVSGIDNFTPAKQTDLKVGDCVLKVNGYDVLGLRLTEIAKLTKSTTYHVTLHVWRTSQRNAHQTSSDNSCIWSAPMPHTMQRLAFVVQNILHIIECPVCFTTITPPAMQCQEGHLLCLQCRIRAHAGCPICRGFYTPRPNVTAEKIYNTLTQTFHLCKTENKIRQKLFGRHRQQQEMIKNHLSEREKQKTEQESPEEIS